MSKRFKQELLAEFESTLNNRNEAYIQHFVEPYREEYEFHFKYNKNYEEDLEIGFDGVDYVAELIKQIETKNGM